MGSNPTPPERVLQVFDDFAELGLRMSITEYDAQGAAPDIAADYMRDILICAFSHPAMHNFLMWGFWDGAHWLMSGKRRAAMRFASTPTTSPPASISFDSRPRISRATAN